MAATRSHRPPTPPEEVASTPAETRERQAPGLDYARRTGVPHDRLQAASSRGWPLIPYARAVRAGITDTELLDPDLGPDTTPTLYRLARAHFSHVDIVRARRAGIGLGAIIRLGEPNVTVDEGIAAHNALGDRFVHYLDGLRSEQGHTAVLALAAAGLTSDFPDVWQFAATAHRLAATNDPTVLDVIVGLAPSWSLGPAALATVAVVIAADRPPVTAPRTPAPTFSA